MDNEELLRNKAPLFFYATSFIVKAQSVKYRLPAFIIIVTLIVKGFS